MSISAQNVVLPQSNADLHQGPVATAMGAANLLGAVMAERRTRLLSTLAFVACISSQCDLTVTQEPETVDV